MVVTEKEINNIDEEWLGLILEAKELGLPIELVQAFLNQSELNE